MNCITKLMLKNKKMTNPQHQAPQAPPQVQPQVQPPAPIPAARKFSLRNDSDEKVELVFLRKNRSIVTIDGVNYKKTKAKVYSEEEMKARAKARYKSRKAMEAAKNFQ